MNLNVTLNRISFILAGLMCAASVGVVGARPGTPAAELGGVVEFHYEDGEVVIRLRGAWVQKNPRPLLDCFSKAVLSERNLQIDLENVSYVDAAFFGLVILLQGHQKQHGRQLQIVSLRVPVQRVIESSK